MSMKQLSNYPAYDNYYHFIAATKYRKNLFYADEIRDRLRKIVEQVLKHGDGIELVECTVAYNHMHVLVKTDVSPSQTGQILLGASSRLLRKEFPVLVEQVEKGLWGGKSWQAIKDAEHLQNCISYIQRHQPDNTKI